MRMAAARGAEGPGRAICAVGGCTVDRTGRAPLATYWPCASKTTMR
jgi:hypothetical protein